MLWLLSKQPRIAAHKKSTEKVVRKLGRPRNRWQDGAKLFSEECCQI